mmetsp:Transcript_23506/g.51586  ORF Transcript_23506/g.51586 Transcript_23506/m.51586 type:complete len:306 (+) Transcript_23506:146-1063(+)
MYQTLRSRIFPATALVAAAAGTWTYRDEVGTRLHSNVSAQAEGNAPVAIGFWGSWTPLKLVHKEQVAKHVNKYRFAFDDPNAVAGYQGHSFILTRANVAGQGMLVRPYSPVTSPSTKGHIEFIIKSYHTGRMSKHIGELEIGDELLFKLPPFTRWPYTPNMRKQLAMVAGGTGITPMLQITHQILENPDDKTEISLVLANQKEDYIIWKSHIDELVKKHPGRVKVHYVLTQPRNPAFWHGSTGYVTADILKAHLPPPSEDVTVLVCGPEPMMKAVCGPYGWMMGQGSLEGALKELGYSSSQVFKV